MNAFGVFGEYAWSTSWMTMYLLQDQDGMIGCSDAFSILKMNSALALLLVDRKFQLRMGCCFTP